MQKLQLHYSNMIQGKFDLQKLNLLFVFQVNCPGCFLYGLPVVNRIYHQFRENVSVLGISTAFEDFEFNNLGNTQLLVDKRAVVGETKKALKKYDFEGYPESIDFPIAMDERADSSFNFEDAAEGICRMNSNYESAKSDEKGVFRQRVLAYLRQLPEISLTFTLNQLRGTPSFILFNDQYEILEQWFGHREIEEIQKTLDYFIVKA